MEGEQDARDAPAAKRAKKEVKLCEGEACVASGKPKRAQDGFDRCGACGGGTRCGCGLLLSRATLRAGMCKKCQVRDARMKAAPGTDPRSLPCAECIRAGLKMPMRNLPGHVQPAGFCKEHAKREMCGCGRDYFKELGQDACRLCFREAAGKKCIKCKADPPMEGDACCKACKPLCDMPGCTRPRQFGIRCGPCMLSVPKQKCYNVDCRLATYAEPLVPRRGPPTMPLCTWCATPEQLRPPKEKKIEELFRNPNTAKWRPLIVDHSTQKGFVMATMDFGDRLVYVYTSHGRHPEPPKNPAKPGQNVLDEIKEPLLRLVDWVLVVVFPVNQEAGLGPRGPLPYQAPRAGDLSGPVPQPPKWFIEHEHLGDHPAVPLLGRVVPGCKRLYPHRP
eukprot:tig00021339_g20396.t1